MNNSINVTVASLDDLACIICAIDFAINEDTNKAKQLVTDAHTAIERMLGEHAHLVYWPDDVQEAA